MAGSRISPRRTQYRSQPPSASWCTPRIVVKHANGIPLVEERLYERGADKATAAGDENRAHAVLSLDFGADINPVAGVVCTAGGIEQDLNAKAFGKPRSGALAALDKIEEAACEAGDWRDSPVVGETAIQGIVDFYPRQCRGPAG